MDTSLIGQESSPRSVVVEQGQLQFFAKATGTKDKQYWDVDGALAAGHRALPAPPTFLFSLDLLAASGEPGILAQLGVDIGRILHGEQRFKYGAQIYAGDTITMATKVTDMYEKKGGKLQFVITETKATNQDNVEVGSMSNSIVIRN